MSALDVRLSLIAHTNVGKTSLARTLLGRDVGEILDAEHTTLDASVHELVRTPDGDRLLLWDTPGFGNSSRLLERLRQQDSPVGWFLGQVWDRIADRSLWCSQQAVRNVRDDADAVLYLVNASEDPELASYIDAELEILSWIGKPVILLLNQLPPRATRADDRGALEARWRALAERRGIRDVLALDAFARCWLDEAQLLTCLLPHLQDDSRAALERLIRVWQRSRIERFEAAVDAISEALLTTATDREGLPRGQPRRFAQAAALKRMAARLEQRLDALVSRLVELEKLDAADVARVEAALTEIHAHGERPSPMTGAAGGALAGAGAGAALDLALSGLTFGIFTALGAALSGAAAWRWCYESIDARRISWSEAFVTATTAGLVARYLAIAHHGRARGAWTGEALASWNAAAADALSPALLADLYVRATRRDPDLEALRPRVHALVREALVSALQADYPQAEALLEPQA